MVGAVAVDPSRRPPQPGHPGGMPPALSDRCLRTWPPATCRPNALDAFLHLTGEQPPAAPNPPTEHLCAEPRSRPHICRCARCDP